MLFSAEWSKMAANKVAKYRHIKNITETIANTRTESFFSVERSFIFGSFLSEDDNVLLLLLL